MLILASKSPRRQELLKLITDDFTVKTADVEECLPQGIAPHEAVLYLSKIKAEPLANDSDVVIGADTVVAVDGRILGKPTDRKNAKEMLCLLSGREHSVFTGVTIFYGKTPKSFYVQTKVKFFELTDDEMNWYVSTGECDDKAGAYGI